MAAAIPNSPRPPSIILSEPFRIFFPAATLTSVIGVMLWPLLYAGMLNYYPGEAHARLMVEGFVGGFALGFLTTAFPKLIECPPLERNELIPIFLSYLGSVAFHTFGVIPVGDGLFILTWLLTLFIFLRRFMLHRKDLPPAGFTIAFLGLMAGITGAGTLVLGRFVPLPYPVIQLAQLFLYEAFILGPIMGVGGFLFPRFFLSKKIEKAQPSRWSTSRGFNALVGMLVLATYVLQTTQYPVAGPVLRAAMVSAYLFMQVFNSRQQGNSNRLSLMLRVSIICLVIGILVSGVATLHTIAVKHVLFIGGYGLLILTVASRVIWGHAGQLHLANQKRKTLAAILGFILFALATRVIADVIPEIKISHHIYAAICWAIGVGVWSIAALRFVTRVESEEEPVK